MKTRYFSTLAMLLTLFACSDQDYESHSTQLLMEFGTEYPMQTRANDAGFADGDRMGIFVYDNINMPFTYDEANDKWNGTNTIYWKDATTPVDVIGYYPYSSTIEDAANYSFSISTRQDKCGQNGEIGGYEASDLLWAKAEAVQPGSGKVMLNYSHIMAGITIVLEKGEGFTDTEWAEAKKQAYVCNAITSATVNLEEGAVSVSEGAATAHITPTEYSGTYRAVLIPQTYKQGEQILGIDVNGQNYALTKSELTQFASGKMHKYTLKVDKRADTGQYEFALVAESISQWIDDEDFHTGIVRQYITVNVETPGTFAQTLVKMGLNYENITSLKVTGRVNDDDIMFMGDMPTLTSINMKEMVIDNGKEYHYNHNSWNSCDDVIPHEAFRNSMISHLVLPDRLKEIGYMSFFETSIIGTLVFPEGLERINGWAFAQTYGTTSPSNFKAVFPSTLKRLDEWAFGGNGIHTSIKGNLELPEGLEYIGENAFWSGSTINGSLRLPESIKYIGESAFSECNFTGDLVIPSSLKEIPTSGFSENKFDGNLIIPDGVETIKSCAFAGCKFRGEINIPASVQNIGLGAFLGNHISGVTLPKDLQLLGACAFENCVLLSTPIVLPERISAVPEACFRNCPMITSVELNKNVQYIDKSAFEGCSHLTNIICHNPEPPILDATAFNGIVKTQVNVEVPREGLNAYKQNKTWHEFSRLTEYRNFVCRPATACALNDTHQQTLVLNADADWKVVHQPEWVKLSKTSGSMKTSIDLTFSDMSKGADMRTDSIVFQLEGSDVKTYCKLSQYNYQYAEDEVVTLQQHKKGNGIGIYFVGDGWDGEVIASGEYLNLCRQDMEYFFGLPPYDRLRDYFDAYAIIALSQEKGINTMNTYRDTRFSTLYSFGDDLNPPRYYAYEEEVFPYISNLTGLRQGQWWQDGDMWKSLVVLIPNCTDYPGVTAYYDDGSTISICPPSIRSYPNDTRGTIQHEAGGHGFGKLGDELITANKYAPDKILKQIEEMHGRGWYQNLATTGVAANVPWSFLIYDQRYSNYVDIFEGGYGYTRRIWRSEANSCMNYGIPYYNAISRLDITRRVHDLAGEWFDINRDFYDVDTDEWGSTEVGGTRAVHQMEYLSPIHSHTAPIMLKRGQYNELFKKIKNRKYEINR